MQPWRELELAAPEIAEPGKARLEEARVALLATLRRDGSPRISPVEPYFAEGHLLFGAMAWTLKVRDLERDARCTLHSAITGPNEREGELKLYGRAIEADEEVRAACHRRLVERPTARVRPRLLAEHRRSSVRDLGLRTRGDDLEALVTTNRSAHDPTELSVNSP